MNTARGFGDYTFRELKEYLLELERRVADLKKEAHAQLQTYYKDIDIDEIYCELRGLLKERAQFPEQWDTNERLVEWLKSKNQYD
jgi:hypothetical protein